MRLLHVVGARPQFVKMAVVHRAIARHTRDSSRTGRIEETICHTGQHYDTGMSRVFFDELGIPEPQRNLGVGSGAHGRQTGEMLAGLDAFLVEEPPDLVLTYGDTNSTLAAALAAAKRHVAVAHVESGLRSCRKSMPEEVNRVLTDHVSTILFCPTETAVENLRKEGLGDPVAGGALLAQNAVVLEGTATVDAPWIVNVGDVMYDSVLHHVGRASEGASRWIVDLARSEHALMTVHRAENTDDRDRLSEILEAASDLAEEGLPVLFPAHPRTVAAMEAAGIVPRSADVRVIEPLSYYDMLGLLRSARIVLTDSGGVQREAFMLGRPCVTLRDETEWIELLKTGMSLLGGATRQRIVEAAHCLLSRGDAGPPPRLYGDGHAAERIVRVCLEWGRRSLAR